MITKSTTLTYEEILLMIKGYPDIRGPQDVYNALAQFRQDWYNKGYEKGLQAGIKNALRFY